MAELVALDLAPSAGFVDVLEEVWDAGDAACPIDPRLPPAARTRVLDALAPTAVIGPDRERRSLPGGRPAEDGDALVVATSGSTGDPKAVVLTHDAVAASARATSERLGVDPDRDRWLACLPLAHIGGLSVVTRALLTGTPLVVHDRFDAAATNAAAASGATLVSLVATALGRVDPAGFRTVVLGGSAPPDALPANVVTTYGMTETGSGVVYDGRPLDGVELRIGDGTLGESGEVLVRGPMLLRAYRDGTDPRLPGGWLPTGDAGSLGGDGVLAVQGRIAEVIVTGGEKVWPAEVESVLARLDSVAEVAVTGRFDPEWGQAVVAQVVPQDPAAPPTLEELRDAVRAVLAPWAAPRHLVVVDALPRTASGKVQKRLVREGIAVRRM